MKVCRLEEFIGKNHSMQWGVYPIKSQQVDLPLLIPANSGEICSRNSFPRSDPQNPELITGYYETFFPLFHF